MGGGERERKEKEKSIYLLVVISGKSVLHRKEVCLFVCLFVFFFIKEKIESEEELLNELFLPSVTKT